VGGEGRGSSQEAKTTSDKEELNRTEERSRKGDRDRGGEDGGESRAKLQRKAVGDGVM
jgi:hypothetical protein